MIDLERKLDSEPITVSTLYWIWDYLQRIEPTGTHGANYSHDWKPEFVDALGPYAVEPFPSGENGKPKSSR